LLIFVAKVFVRYAVLLHGKKSQSGSCSCLCGKCGE
jgi:hypothetical protein